MLRCFAYLPVLCCLRHHTESSLDSKGGADRITLKLFDLAGESFTLDAKQERKEIGEVSATFSGYAILY